MYDRHARHNFDSTIFVRVVVSDFRKASPLMAGNKIAASKASWLQWTSCPTAVLQAVSISRNCLKDSFPD
jgi:hypothetical protein